MKSRRAQNVEALIVQGRAVVSRPALVHGIANCLDCKWECSNYCTVQRSARRHTEQTGHNVSMELGYHVTISPPADQRLVRPPPCVAPEVQTKTMKADQ